MSEPRNIADMIKDIAASNPAIIVDLGGQDTFDKTIKKISAFDTQFSERGQVFFSLGATPMETAERFTQIHIEQYRDTGRPSLPALVAHHLDDIGLAKDSPHYKAAVLVAARAEIDLAKTPQYHNTEHYADVTAHVAELLKRNNELAAAGVPGAIKLTKEEMADSITAAVGHDLEHPGGKNNLPGQKPGEFDPLRLEKIAFNAMLPLMQEAGLPQKSIDEIKVMIMTTSPDGPHGMLKSMAKSHIDGTPIDFDKFVHAAKFPELRVLVDDPKLTARAAILEDSDLGASAFEGMKSNTKMSQIFTEELQERDYRKMAAPDQLEDLRGPGARLGFSKFVVGDGPASLAAQASVGQNYTEMFKATEEELRQSQVAATKERNIPTVSAAPKADEPKVITADQLRKTIPKPPGGP